MNYNEILNYLNQQIYNINNNLDNQIDYVQLLQEKITTLQDNINLIIEKHLLYGTIEDNIQELNNLL